MSRNRFSFIAVCARNASLTTNPFSAIRMAGRSASASEIVPQRRSALAQVAGVPGTPTDSPELTASANGSGLPVAGSTNESARMAAGAVSRPSMVCTRCERAS